MVPLYFSPGERGLAWKPLYAAIAANPKVVFTVIVDPAHGQTKMTKCPNADFLAGLKKLASFRNTVTLGYVATGYGPPGTSAKDHHGVTLATLKAKIRAYAMWSATGGCGINGLKINGIFFDEVFATTKNLGHYTSLSKVVKNTYLSGLGIGWVVLNPGLLPAKELPSRQYFNIADSVVVFEGKQASFREADLSSVASIARTKKVMLAHEVLLFGSASIRSAVARARAANIGAMYLTNLVNETRYGGFPSFLGQFATQLGAGCS